MSQRSSKSKLDLLVRVRYVNPLPAPPFPPKLLTIPTSPDRYADPKFTEPLAAETPFPMIVDADAGMPLDLLQWEGLWHERADDSQINPSKEAEMDPRDAFLLSDTVLPSTAGPSSFANGHSFSGHSFPGGLSSGAPTPSWLRKTEYLSRDSSSRHIFEQSSQSSQDDAIPDISREAQIRDIEASFAAQEHLDLDTLRHPAKPNLRAIAAYDVLPDDEIWANAYDLFKFSERPGERPADHPDPRLNCAILRPMESDGDHFLAYYLTQTDEDATLLKSRRHGQVDDPSYGVDSTTTALHFVRDYETVKIEQEVPNEFVLVLDDGNQAPAHIGDDPPQVRRPGAYYKNIERKIALKKKRVNKYELAYSDKWDIVQLSYTEMATDEARERGDAFTQVRDPGFWAEALAERQKRVTGRTNEIMDDIMGGDVDLDLDGEAD
ncbi:Paf1-domain-containing protein [Auriculariales sp. MPI-PUGE-AT-0066]|nr:Paf1-domain-containing protein [Auriculariales sp. MPI-PUGE-AT-0066]